ncbi:MAG TPA: class I SAM-dependent methyltransferase [Caldimonas sp.]|nr:class I SAM-dependent methyltransferase [Caldimonas sp.]
MAHTLSSELAQTYRQIEALLMLTRCLPLRQPLPPMRGASISPDLALLLHELVHTHHPALVVELGAGVSTLVIGYALESAGTGRLITFEHDERHAQRTLGWVRRHGLERRVHVVHAGLQETRLAGEAWQWYGPEVEETLVGQRAGLVFIDGPPGSLQPLARYPARRRLAPFLGDEAVIVLDDVARPDEWAITERWLRDDPRLTLQRIAHEKGTAILTRSR